MNEKRVRGLYEAPETELIVLVERWNILQDPSQPTIANGEEEDWGEIGGN